MKICVVFLKCQMPHKKISENKKREGKRMCKRITDKREKKKYAVFALFAFLFAASVFFFSGKTEVRAGPLDNAIDYYNTYGEKDVSPQIIAG